MGRVFDEEIRPFAYPGVTLFRPYDVVDRSRAAESLQGQRIHLLSLELILHRGE